MARTLGYGRTRAQNDTDIKSNNSPPDDNLIPMTVWSQVRPIHLMLAGAAILFLLLVVFLSWPSRELPLATPSIPAPALVPSPSPATAVAPPRAPEAIQIVAKPSGPRAKHPDETGNRSRVKPEDRDPFEDAGPKTKKPKLDSDPFEHLDLPRGRKARGAD